MKATSESTSADDVAIRLLLPSALAARVLAYEDELQRLQTAQAEQDQRLDDGRLTTSKRLRGVVLAAIQNTRAKLEADVPTNRRHVIEEHLKTKWEHYGLERLDDKVKLPNRKLINQVLKSQGL